MFYCVDSVCTVRCRTSAVYAVSVCLSVRPSVRLSRVGVLPKPLNVRIVQTTSYDSPAILVFWSQDFGNIPHGSKYSNGRLIENRRRPIEWHQYQWPWLTLKITFSVLNLSNSHTSGNVACTVYLHTNWKCTWSTKLDDFSRSQATVQAFSNGIFL